MHIYHFICLWLCINTKNKECSQKICSWLYIFCCIFSYCRDTYTIIKSILEYVFYIFSNFELKYSYFSVYRIYTKKIRLFNGDLYDFVKKYWFLFFLASILVLISTVKIGWYWMNNCLDDGYYLNRIATLPYIDHPLQLYLVLVC